MLAGGIVTIVTPMDEEGNVCRTSLKKLIDHHVTSDASAIISVGTTDESATLNHDGHAGVVTMMPELADERIPVVTGAGANATTEAIGLTQRFNDSGIVGRLMVTPHYNHPSQEGLHQRFKAIAGHTDPPQILYNVPFRVGYNLLPETVDRLAKVENIVGTKEATGNLTRVNQIKGLAPDDFILLSGDDVNTLDFVRLGGHGVISVTTNVVTRDVAQMCKLAAEEHFAEARIIDQRLMPLHNKLFVEPNPTPTKRVCKELGLIAIDVLRLPMTPIADSDHEMIRAVLKHAGLL